MSKRLAMGAAAVAAALFVLAWVVMQFQPVGGPRSAHQYVRVQSGQSASEVAAALQAHHIIRSAWAFDLLSRYNGLATHLTAGVYRLSPHQSLHAIMSAMRSGDVVVTRVTIPEGFTAIEIAQRLTANHIGSMQQYQRLLKKPLPGMPQPLPGVRYPMEGYLFPATYSFPYGTTAPQALEMMWKTFQARVVGGLYDRSHSRLSVVQWVTLASIVQSEDKLGGQARDVAAVFMNRRAIGMPFQSDATVRYALAGRVTGGLTLGDLTVASPYNTYLHKGFPPGPICNPGLAMLEAALHPAHVSYLYFLSLRSGKMLFATTYQEHLAHIAYANSHPGA